MNTGRPQTDQRPGSMSFGASGFIHGMLLAWLVLAAANTPRETPKSLYDLEIRPYEDHIVWYNLREKLPDITPVALPEIDKPKPVRAARKFQQTLISGAKDDARAPQFIATDAPPVEFPKPLPLPNAIAAAPPPKPKLFIPPELMPEEAKTPSLPDSPRALAKSDPAADPLHARAPAPQPLPFRPPEEKPAVAADKPRLPDAPKVSAAAPGETPSPITAAAPKPKPLAFHEPPPLPRPRNAAALTLPESPRVATPGPAASSSPLGNTAPRPQPRAFQAPSAAAAKPPTQPALPDAPAGGVAASPASAGMPRIPRQFSSPSRRDAPQPARASLTDAAPAVTDPGASSKQSFVIAGLDPAKSAEIPDRPPSHDAAFSAATEVRPGTGTAATNENSAVVVPSLTAGGGVHDSLPTRAPAATPSARARLLAELRTPLDSHLGPVPGDPAPKAARVSSSPDPRMSGRVVYTMAIQMPNVTSYSGSWMVWFAEHVPEPGSPAADVRPPVPLHVVHPAYIRSAADAGIEGVIRLAGVIGKDGHMRDVELLSGIDSRLDNSAQEALAKWLFEPAQRNGTPIDVDAVFEVPFHLAPKPLR